MSCSLLLGMSADKFSTKIFFHCLCTVFSVYCIYAKQLLLIVDLSSHFTLYLKMLSKLENPQIQAWFPMDATTFI